MEGVPTPHVFIEESSMITFEREQTEEEKKKRKARYKAMSEEELRAQVDRFTRDIKEGGMIYWVSHLKTNSLCCAIMELYSRGIRVDPVITSIQKNNIDNQF